MKMKVSDYNACYSGDVVLFFNGWIRGSAEGPGFNPGTKSSSPSRWDGEIPLKSVHTRLNTYSVHQKPEPPPTTETVTRPEPASERRRNLKTAQKYCDIDLLPQHDLSQAPSREPAPPIVRSETANPPRAGIGWSRRLSSLRGYGGVCHLHSAHARGIGNFLPQETQNNLFKLKLS